MAWTATRGTNRLLVGANVSIFAIPEQEFIPSQFNVGLRPFARYYFPGGEKRSISYFGEVGFGTCSLFDGSGFETDFHFGGGVEKALFPGVVATALLRYDANASGLNFTRLNLGLHILLGQLENTENGISLEKGTFTADADIAGFSFGRMERGGSTDQFGSLSISPTAGYFLLDQLMVEIQTGIAYSRLSRNINRNTLNQTTTANFALNLRYYPKTFGKLLPYATAGIGLTSFNTRVTTDLFGEDRTSFTTDMWQGGLGATLFLSPQLALDGTVLYQRTTSEQSNIFPLGTFTQRTLSFEVGFKFFLPRR
ncbi:MAG: outer membrane beta-barrel protein [Bacteroidota bacterium]